MRGHPEVSAALEEAFAVFRSLGATLGEVRLRPAQDYYDVKVTIAESELLAVHEQALRTRPGDFGEDFLGRVLPAVLISGRDYVQAQRERRRMLAEMAPVYADYDVLVTATAGGAGAASRHLAHDRVLAASVPDDAVQCHRAARRWRSASASAATACRCRCKSSAGPSTTRRCCGSRMPTRRRRPGGRSGPQLDPDAEFSTALPPVPDPEPAQIDAATRDRVAVACRAAGLTLSERQFEMVCAAAPYVIAMTGRLYRDRSYGEEPANVFQFAG